MIHSETEVSRIPQGLRVHPYVTEEITIQIDKKQTIQLENIIRYFDHIFGVNDDTKGLFQFGPTTQQKREGEALKAMGSMFGTVIKAAKDGEIPEDAATSGLAKYSRLADEAEEKVK